MTEAISRRPIVLIGDVGVGKTSFLKHLIYISAFKEFQNAIYIYIDLGSQGALSANLNEFVLAEIETQLYSRYQIDVHEDRFVRGVYHSDILRFQRGIHSGLRDQEPQIYAQKLLAFLEEKTYLFTADAGVGAGQKRPPRLSYSACSGPGGSRFANWANGLNGLRASWVD